MLGKSQNSLPSIEQKVEGPFQDRKLSLVVRPGRVDWALSAAVPTEEALADMITMGTLSDSLTVLGDVADRWMQLDRCPTFQRLAVAIVLLLPMESEQAGYERLSTYLPHVELDPVNSSDFYYQINRPRMSRVLGSELRINRLSKWSVGMWRRAMLTSGRAKDLPGSTQYACRAELDVNTDADFEGQIEVAQMSPLFAELVKYVVEISNEGDRP